MTGGEMRRIVGDELKTTVPRHWVDNLTQRGKLAPKKTARGGRVFGKRDLEVLRQAVAAHLGREVAR